MNPKREFTGVLIEGWIGVAIVLITPLLGLVRAALHLPRSATLRLWSSIVSASGIGMIVVAGHGLRKLRLASTTELAELSEHRGLLEETERALAAKRHRVAQALTQPAMVSMVYQPILDLEEGSVVGVEALARFADSRPPDVWFAEADQVGLGPALERHAITLAFEHLPDGVYLSVNVSPATLTCEETVQLVSSRPELAGRLVLELTEHTVVQNYDALTRTLTTMRTLGVRVAVDDVGSGFASMRHILAVSPDIIKLDRALVSSVHDDPNRGALAASLVGFAHAIGADLVAEGVEQVEELAACKQLGIRYAQGYLLGRPERVIDLRTSAALH